MYQDTTSTYIYGISIQALYLTGPYNAAAIGTLNYNRTTRREQFNLLQDLGCITGAYSTPLGAGYTGFVSAWAGGFPNVSDLWRQNSTLYDANALSTGKVENVHWFGQYSYIWRYDTTSKQVIARSIVNMTKNLWGANSENWKKATISDGYVTNLNNGLFSVNINNVSTYGILVFDKDLTPKKYYAIHNIWRYFCKFSICYTI
jgi:hypothetical protein